MQQITLWETLHYRIIADEFPRCVGHVLLLAKEHFPAHAAVPIAHEEEFDLARAHMRRFLQDRFGAATFVEHGGGSRHYVPHAHLHGYPFAADVPLHLREPGGTGIRPIAGWRDAREE